MNLSDDELKQASTQKVFSTYKTGLEGLTHDQVELNRQQFGSNQMKKSTKRAWWRLLLRQYKSTFVYILIGAAGVSLFLGEWVDAATILAILVANGLLGFFQEFHSQKITDKLKSIIQLDIEVRRDNSVVRIPKEDVVIGDILIVKPGTVLPADVRWILSERLTINESVLTGESVPVSKISQPNADHSEMILGLAGTHVMTGYGEGVVVATGSQSALGKIIELTSGTKRISSFEQGIKRLSRFMLWIVVVTLVVVFVVNIALKGSDQILIQLLFAIALAVSVIPEALPAVVTITFTKGALLLSKKKVVVKRLSAIEDLGHVQVLCTDKTGTITKNEMTVKGIVAKDEAECLRLALLTSEAEPSTFDLAIQNASPDTEILKTWKTIWNLPFDPERKRGTVVVKKQSEVQMITKGTPEIVLDLCAEIKNKKDILIQAKEFGKKGMRVLAVAYKLNPSATDGNYQEDGFTFSGLIAFEDPLKETAKQAIQEAEELGIRVKILTGDGLEVARAIAEQVGILQQQDQIMTGGDFIKLSPAQKLTAAEKVHVFARVTPEEKYQIIQHLQQKYVVGFIGEGINDAPALQLANIGLVVQNASDVAREAADIILLDPSLEVIVDGIKQGREIFANVSKYIRYTLIGNFGGFYAIAGISLIIPFLPMLPIQILLNNLLTDLPLVAVAGDYVDPEEVKKPPSYNIKEFALIGIFLGLISSIFDFVFFAYFRNSSPETIQTLWFTLSVLTELSAIFLLRTRKFVLRAHRPHRSLVIPIVLVTFIIFTIPYIPFTANIFHLIQPSFWQILVLLGITAAYLVVTEISKLLYYKIGFDGGKS